MNTPLNETGRQSGTLPERVSALMPAPAWTGRVLLSAGIWTLLLFCIPPLAGVARRSDPPPRQVLRDIRTLALPPPLTPVPEPLVASPSETPLPPAAPLSPLAPPRLDPPPLKPEWTLPSPDLQGRLGVFTGFEQTAAQDLVFALAEVDIPPQPVFQPSPRYPYAARQSGIEGWVELEFVVSIDGQVADVLVSRSHPGTVFAAAAVEAVTRWRFEPARRRGEPVAVRVHLPLAFKLER